MVVFGENGVTGSEIDRVFATLPFFPAACDRIISRKLSGDFLYKTSDLRLNLS